MAIERLVYECSKVGIEKDYSGGQVYSYSQGMKALMEETEPGLSKLEDYREPVDFESDPEDNLAPLSYTFSQMEQFFPKQFRYQFYGEGENALFALSANSMSVDWDVYENYEDYLENKNRDEIVGGRSGSHEYFIVAGPLSCMTEYPCCYYQSETMQVPYTAEDFCSTKKPSFLPELQQILPGDVMTAEAVRVFIDEEADRDEYLKRMAYFLMRYDTEKDLGYNKNLVICDDHSDIIYWISALTMLFDRPLSRELSFSTYEYSPIGAEYRICGAFPRGTDYDAEGANSASYVFDFWHDRFPDVDEDELEFCDFLVNAFLYNEDMLREFYQFLEFFSFDSVSEKLEGIYYLYLLIRQKESLDEEQILRALPSASLCRDEKMTKDLLVKFVNIYMQSDIKQSAELCGMIEQFLREKSRYLSSLENACAGKLLKMLSPQYRADVAQLRRLHDKYERLFHRVGGNLSASYFRLLQANMNNLSGYMTGVEKNVYIAEHVTEYIAKSDRPIDVVEPRFPEGNILRSLVEKILSAGPDTETCEEAIKVISKAYQTQTYEYLFVVISLEKMVKNSGNGQTQNWLSATEKCINDYLETTETSENVVIYRILVELSCEDKVIANLKKRASKRGRDVFELLFHDVKLLMEECGQECKRSAEMISILLAVAKKRISCRDELENILSLYRVVGNNSGFLEAAQLFVQNVSVSDFTVRPALWDNIAEIIETNNQPVNAKVAAAQFLKQIEAMGQTQKNQLLSQIEEMDKSWLRTRDFPKVPFPELTDYNRAMASAVADICVITGSGMPAYFINYSFRDDPDLGKQRDNYSDLFEKEMKFIVRRMKKSDIELIAGFIFLSHVCGCAMSGQSLSDLLIQEKISASKLNKYIQERQGEMLNQIRRRTGLDVNPDAAGKFLAYWEDVYLNMDTEGGMFKKVMGAFKKK